MSILATAFWRIRPSGNDANGGGFDCSISTQASGSNGSASGSVFTDTVAAAFTGTAGSALNISGVGQYKIASATATTATVTGTLPTSSHGKLVWTVSTGTDYSQQNSPQGTFDGVTIAAHTSGITTTIILTGYTVASGDIGNGVNITGGTNFIAGFYFIQSVNVGLNTWTLDRNATSGAGTGMTGRMGGGWANIASANTNSTGPIVGGNVIYILGSGVPTPGASGASYTFDYTVSANVGTWASAATGLIGYVKYKGDPATPSFTGTIGGGMPCIKCTDCLMAFDFGFGAGAALWTLEDMWIVVGGNSNHKVVASDFKFARNVIFDQNGYDAVLSTGAGTMIGCEYFSNQAKRTTNAQFLTPEHYGPLFGFSNFHDTVGIGIETGSTGVAGQLSITNCLISKCRAAGISIGSSGSNSGYFQLIGLNTIDGNTTDGVTLQDTRSITSMLLIDNVISNNATGVNGSEGTSLAANNAAVFFFDWNTYYSNTAAYNTISAGADDVTASGNPFTAQSTENYTLATGILTYKQAFPAAPYPNKSQTPITQTFVLPGGVQPKNGRVPAVTSYTNAYPGLAFPNNLASQTPPQTYMFPGAVQLAGAQPIRNRGMIFGEGARFPVGLAATLALGKVLADNPVLDRRQLFTFVAREE